MAEHMPRGRGKRAKLHDCGRHGRMTVKQIAAFARLKERTIYARLDRGIEGEALCEARRFVRRASVVDYRLRTVHGSGHTGIAVAVHLARAFPHKPPSVDELRSRFQMSRATAYRWRAAFVDAMVMQS